MFGSQVLDVAIGLAFVFFVLSLACAGLAETLLRVVEARAKFLEEGLKNMLGDGRARVQQLYRSPLLRAFQGRKPFSLRSAAPPTAIDTRSFALALTAEYVEPTEREGDLKPPTYKELRERVAGTKDRSTEREVLLALLDEAGGDVATWRKGIERWFDAAMVETSSWYKRRTRSIVVVIAIALCFALNVDSLMIGGILWRDGTLRDAVVAVAKGYEAFAPHAGSGSKQSGSQDAGTESRKDSTNDSAKITTQVPAKSSTPDTVQASTDGVGNGNNDKGQLPPAKESAADVHSITEALRELMAMSGGWFGLELLGWSPGSMRKDGSNPRGLPHCPRDYVLKIAGLFVSVFAATVGAPFWFNVVQLLFGLRSKVLGKPEDSEQQT